MSIMNSYDILGETFTSPSLTLKVIERFPEAVLVTFQQEALKLLLKLKDAVQIGHVCGGTADVDINDTAITANISKNYVPIYKASFKGRAFAFYRSPSRADACTGVLERVIAMGGQKFLFFGPCATLGASNNADYIIPTGAYRSRAGSSHYPSPASCGKSYIYVEINTAWRLSRLFDEINAPYIFGKTWTLGKPCPELLADTSVQAAESCIAVEMDCANIMTTGRFHSAEIYQFFYPQYFFGEASLDVPFAANKVSEGHLPVALEIIRRL